MHFLYLHSNFRKAEPQCHLPLVGSPSHRSKSSHQLSIPKPSEALPFPRQLDSAASNIHGQAKNSKSARQVTTSVQPCGEEEIAYQRFAPPIQQNVPSF